MKYLLYSLTLFAFLVVQSEVRAQKFTKEELKVWKDKQKNMDPLEYKRIVEEHGKLQRAHGAHQRTTKETRKDIEANMKIIERNQVEIDTLIERQKALNASCGDKDVSYTGKDYTKGVVYKVQIGAFEKIDLSEFADIAGNFRIENENGVKKYTIAYFDEYRDAHLFKNYMRAMGITDAWVVVYEDNVRQNINKFISKEESLEDN